MSKGQFLMLRKYATNIDVLITEGTMLRREDKAISEYRGVDGDDRCDASLQVCLCFGLSYGYRTIRKYKSCDQEDEETFVYYVLVYEKNDGALY